MREWPMLLAEPLVRAVIEDRKTLTRRIGGFWHKVKPGDRLYIRETWGYRGAGWSNQKPGQHDVSIAYRADNSKRVIVRLGDEWDDGLPKQHPPPEPKHDGDFEAIEARNAYFARWWKAWRPSIHQPRWATRELLEVVSNREEPLHAITEEDAKAEGIVPLLGIDPHQCIAGDGRRFDEVPHIGAFAVLWDEVNGDRAPWKSKPDVRRVEFRRLGDGARVSMEGV